MSELNFAFSRFIEEGVLTHNQGSAAISAGDVVGTLWLTLKNAELAAKKFIISQTSQFFDSSYSDVRLLLVAVEEDVLIETSLADFRYPLRFSCGGSYRYLECTSVPDLEELVTNSSSSHFHLFFKKQEEHIYWVLAQSVSGTQQFFIYTLTGKYQVSFNELRASIGEVLGVFSFQISSL